MKNFSERWSCNRPAAIKQYLDLIHSFNRQGQKKELFMNPNQNYPTEQKQTLQNSGHYVTKEDRGRNPRHCRTNVSTLLLSNHTADQCRQINRGNRV